MKIAGGLTVILLLGALEPLQALSTPLGKVDGGVGVAYNKKKGLQLEQKDNKVTESHKRSEVGGNSHVTGSDGSVTDSEFNKSHQEDKKDETKNTRQLSIGGEDGGLNYAQTKETSGTSQQTDEETSRIRQKQEGKETHGFVPKAPFVHIQETEKEERFLERCSMSESGDGYYYNRESENEDKNKQVKEESYEKKESSGFRLGKDGFQKGKTESSEKLKTSETNEHSSSNRELEEESIQNGDKRIYKKRSSEAKDEVKNSSSSETSSKFSSDGGVKNADSAKAGEVDNLSGSNVYDPSKLRRKRNTIYTSRNENYEHKQEDHLTNYNSEQGHLKDNNEQHKSSTNENYGAQKNINREHGNEKAAHHTNYGFEKSHLTHDNENHRSTNENYGAQENINRENHQFLGLQHGNENAAHYTNNGFEKSHLTHDNENHRSTNENYGAQENINTENHHFLGLQHGNKNTAHHTNNGFEKSHLTHDNENHRSANENYAAQENINTENHHFLGLQHGNKNAAHHTNNGVEKSHLTHDNENHRSTNENYGAQENINRENHQFLGLQHGNENAAHYTNNGFEKSHLTHDNENHRSTNEHYGAQENINRENHQFLGLQHGNENAVHYTNNGFEKSHLIHDNENHGSTNENYGAQENINRENQQYLGLKHGNDNSEFKNIHRTDKVNHFSGNEHYDFNHGSYGFKEGHQYSPSVYNREHESNNGNYNLNRRNSNHYTVNSGSEKIRHENHRSESAFHYSEKPSVNLRNTENANEYYGYRNYGSINDNYKESNLHSGNANQQSDSLRNGNSNDNYEHRNGKVYLTNPGKEYYRSNNGGSKNLYAFGSESNRSNRQGQTLKHYSSSENGNLGSRGRSYRLGNNNYESVPLRNDYSRIINNARNYLYGHRNYGNRQYRFGNGFNGNNANKGISHLGRLESGYRSGVKHEDVRRFLSNNGQRISNEYQRFNPGNHIRHYEPYYTGYRPASNGYLRRYGAYNNQVVKHGAIDLHHLVDDTHYSTGNGRYVLKHGKNGDNYRYYDTLTGLHFDIRKIRLHGGKNVIVPGNSANHPPNNGQPGVEHDNSGQGLDLGLGIFYIGGRNYRHQDQIIPASKIEVYLKTLGISGISLTSDGLPLGLSGGHFPLNLGSGLTYQGDGTYKYQDFIIAHDKIIEFCKSKHINKVSFTKDGFPEDLFNGSLDSIFKTHLKLPIDLGNGLEFIGNGHYKWKDQIIPTSKIVQVIKEHNLDIEITKEGLPLTLFNGALAINVGSTVDGNVDSKEDDLLNPHGIFPYDVGSNIYYDGKGNYIYKNITIPRSNIIEFCKSHDLTKVSFTDDGFPSSLFNEIEHGDIGHTWKYPIYLGDDLYYIDNGHYKYKNQIILASNIGEFIKTNKINVHITKQGLPLGVYFGSSDNVFSPDEKDDVGHESEPINHHEGYPLDLGSKLFYLGNGSYIYDSNEIIDSKDIIEFCKSHSITNIIFTKDGFPSDVFKNIKDGGSEPHRKFPINLGDDLLYYECGQYRHKNKTIPIGGIVEYIKENELNVSVTDYGLPLQFVAENFDSGIALYDNEISGVHKKGLLDIYGDFPYDLGSNIYYLGNGSYRCHNEIIDSSDILNYCKSHQINEIVFTEDGFPASLFHYTVPNKRSDRKFPIDLGKGLRFLGHGHYDYENKIYPCSNIIDIVKSLNLNISLTDDGIPVELIDENELSSFDNTAIDLGEGLFYDHGKYTYKKETIPADKIVEFSKSLNLHISFTEDGYPQLHNDKQTVLSHENEKRECPKGPIDLGEEIVYIGDCHYMYQDHVIPAKYILGLLDILHIHDIQLPVGPDDNFTSEGDSYDTDSKDDHILDLGFEVFSLRNGTYKYKNRYIPRECYAEFLKILGLKIQSGDSEKLVEDNQKSDRSEEDILALIDELLKNIKTTEAQSTSTNDDNTSEETKNNDDSTNEEQSSDLQKSSNDDDSGSSSLTDSGYSTSSSTINSQLSTSDSYKSESSDDSSDSSSASEDNSYTSTYSSDRSTQSNNTSSVTSSDSTSEDTSLSTNSSDSSYSSDKSTVTSDTSSDYSSENSSIRRSVESSATNSSSASYSSNDATTNYESKTTDTSSGDLSSIESKEFSEKSSADSSSYDNSTFSSDSSTINSSHTNDSSSSNDSDATSDSSSNESYNTENNDSSEISSDDSNNNSS
ncbi:unnamed protein product [Arctia plantaginis]|uniref:Uncharacterized protein n=1 Tax=Arctia plantaginis TaxID=874455 RepID=A0A8S0ZWR5_ARCPL|nr:unnamed protein product [Arctia plantaginis]